MSAHRRIGGRGADFLGLDCGEQWVVAVKAGNRRCAVDLRSSLDSHHPPRKRATTRKQRKIWSCGGVKGLLGLGHPGAVQELVERRIHDVGDRVPAVLQHLHALLCARTHIGVQRHLLLPLTQRRLGRTRARGRRGGLTSALMSHRPHHVLLRARRTVVEDSFSRQLGALVGDHLGQVVLKLRCRLHRAEPVAPRRSSWTHPRR